MDKNNSCEPFGGGWCGAPDYVMGCYTDDEEADWAFDHFHAIIDGEPCTDERHRSADSARRAHGQKVIPADELAKRCEEVFGIRIKD